MAAPLRAGLTVRAGVLLALSLAGMLTSVSSGAAEPPPTDWQSRYGTDHPLVGRVWDVRATAFAEPDDLVSYAADAGYVLLGEKHDNPDHHRLQAWVLRALLERGRHLAVAFEMLESDRQDAVSAYVSGGGDAAGFGEAMGWSDQGWPDWELYRPIGEAAFDHGAPILAIDLARPMIRAIVRDGVAALGQDRLQALQVDTGPSEPERAAMGRAVADSHCDQLPAELIDPMVMAQWSRDAHMAYEVVAWRRSSDADGVALITGLGHARADSGIPIHLRRFAPDATVVSLAWVEVADGGTDPLAYAARFGGTAVPFDFVWFTPRVDDQDPCEKYASSLRMLKERYQGQSSGQ